MAVGFSLSVLEFLNACMPLGLRDLDLLSCPAKAYFQTVDFIFPLWGHIFPLVVRGWMQDTDYLPRINSGDLDGALMGVEARMPSRSMQTFESMLGSGPL